VGTVARQVRVTGRVQGVFFRDSCRSAAREHGVAGWVTNEPDGSVRAWFEGPGAAVAALVEWCHSGPPSARVAGVEVDEVAPEGLDGFEVR
jgi:acylphosphatase